MHIKNAKDPSAISITPAAIQAQRLLPSGESLLGPFPEIAPETDSVLLPPVLPDLTSSSAILRKIATHVAVVARAIELALRWRGPGSLVLNAGTGRNHSVMDMLAAARKTATPQVEHQAQHPADVPETLASITAVGTQLGWQPRILFPEGADS